MARVLVNTINNAKFNQVGDVKHAMLDEATFQSIHGTDWVLADGRSVTGSQYETITGNANIPDMRGQFLRGKNNGRADGNENPAGENALGAFENDANKSHTHRMQEGTIGSGTATRLTITNVGDVSFYSSGARNLQMDADGGDETRVKNVTVNIFIKIN